MHACIECKHGGVRAMTKSGSDWSIDASDWKSSFNGVGPSKAFEFAGCRQN